MKRIRSSPSICSICFQKLCKSDRLIQVLSIGIHVLSQKHNFHNTICHKVLNLTDDLPRLSASLPSSYIWNDTILQKLLQPNMILTPLLKRNYVRFGSCSTIWSVFSHTSTTILFILDGMHQKFRKFENIMCAKNQVYKTVALFDLFYYLFLPASYSRRVRSSYVDFFFLYPCR